MRHSVKRINVLIYFAKFFSRLRIGYDGRIDCAVAMHLANFFKREYTCVKNVTQQNECMERISSGPRDTIIGHERLSLGVLKRRDVGMSGYEIGQ